MKKKKNEPNLFNWKDSVKRAERLRDEGMASAADAQERKDPAWADNAFAAISRLAQSQESVHVDDLLRVFHQRPKHPNAWGAVWMRAIRAGILRRTGESRPCESDAAKHKHNYPVYRSLIFRKAAAA